MPEELYNLYLLEESYATTDYTFSFGIGSDNEFYSPSFWREIFTGTYAECNAKWEEETQRRHRAIDLLEKGYIAGVSLHTPTQFSDKLLNDFYLRGYEEGRRDAEYFNIDQVESQNKARMYMIGG